jgi:hypothetical protein
MIFFLDTRWHFVDSFLGLSSAMEDALLAPFYPAKMAPFFAATDIQTFWNTFS